MGEVIDFKMEKKMTNQDYVPFSKDEDYDYGLARNIQKKIADIKNVNDPTRKQIAINLGLILEEFGRELNRGELMEKALGTTYIKPSERLSKFQIRPHSKISESKIKFLSHRLHDYVKISNAAADILGETQSKLLLKLFKNTKFVNSDGKDSLLSSPDVLISDLLNKAGDFFIKKYELSKYFKLCDEYNVTREFKKGDDDYNFIVDHESYLYSSDYNKFIYDYVPYIRLFSIIRSRTTCTYSTNYLDENENIVNKIQKERLIGSIENVSIGIVPSGKNYNPKLVFLNYPSLALLPLTKKTSKKKLNVRTKKMVPVNEYLPSKKYNIIPIEYGTIKQRQFIKKIDYKNKLYEKLIINRKNKLNLEWMNKYLDTGLINNLRDFGGKFTYKFPYRILQLDKNSILDLVDIPIKDIMNDGNSALRKKYDTSRAISPPTSMLAQLEINLFHDGYNLTFDRSESNSWKQMPMANYDLDIDGNIIDLGDVVPNKHDLTIIEELEEEIRKLVNGFNNWRERIENEIRVSAEQKIRKIERNIYNLNKNKN